MPDNELKEAILNRNINEFKTLLPAEIDDDTVTDVFKMILNDTKNKKLSVEESSLIAGITHLEDLDVDEFIDWVKQFYTENIVAVQKLDGTFNMSVVKENDTILFKRLSKKQDTPFTADALPKNPMFNALRGACTFLSDKMVNDTLLENLDNDDAIDIEVLYGTQPNSICYNLDKNYLALLRFIKGKIGDEAENILTKIYQNLSSKFSNGISINNNVYYYNWDAEQIQLGTQKEVWSFAKPEILAELDKQKYNANDDIKQLEDWLGSKNDSIPEITNLQAISVLLSTIPKDDRPKYKEARDKAFEKAAEFKLNIKKKMVDDILKNVNFKIGGNTQEGLVLRNKTTNKMTKLVDKEGFTKANKTNWRYMELSGDGMKIGTEFTPGVIAKFFTINSEMLGIPMLKLRNKLFKQWKTDNNYKENIVNYLSTITPDTKKVADKIVLLKSRANDAKKELVSLNNEAQKDDKLNDFVKKRTSNSIGVIYNQFNNYINEVSKLNLKSKDSDLLVNYLYVLMLCFSNIEE